MYRHFLLVLYAVLGVKEPSRAFHLPKATRRYGLANPAKSIPSRARALCSAYALISGTSTQLVKQRNDRNVPYNSSTNRLCVETRSLRYLRAATRASETNKKDRRIDITLVSGIIRQTEIIDFAFLRAPRPQIRKKNSNLHRQLYAYLRPRTAVQARWRRCRHGTFSRGARRKGFAE